MRLKQEDLRYLNALEMLSGAQARDVIVSGDEIVFVVQRGEMGRAIGKNGATIQRVREKMGKRVELFEFAETPGDFVAKAFPESRMTSSKVRVRGEHRILVTAYPEAEKRRVLRNAGKVKKLKGILKRNFKVDDWRVVAVKG